MSFPTLLRALRPLMDGSVSSDDCARAT